MQGYDKGYVKKTSRDMRRYVFVCITDNCQGYEGIYRDMAKIYDDLWGYASYKLIINFFIITGICRDIQGYGKDMQGYDYRKCYQFYEYLFL